MMEGEDGTINEHRSTGDITPISATSDGPPERIISVPTLVPNQAEETPTVEDSTAEPAELQTPTELTHSSGPPNWAHEVAASRVGRQSRASSIFSTRTKFSTLTLDDARSIEINAGGQSFRISRDGSRITDITAPPPYPGPPGDDITEESPEVQETIDDQDRTVPPTHSSSSTPHLPTSLQSSDNDVVEQELMSSTATKIFKRAFGMSGSSVSPASAAASSDLSSMPNFLRRTQSDTSSYDWLRPWSRGSTGNSRLARASLQHLSIHGNGSLSTDNEIFEENVDEDDNQGTDQNAIRFHTYRNSGKADLESSADTLQRAQFTDQVYESDEDEVDRRAAEISSHYSGLMRDLDRENRRKLHEKDKELSQFRQLLHEKDIVLRQALRDKDIAYEGLKNQVEAKDAIIEDLKTRLANLEDDLELRLEKARNAVEDMWEVRWKSERLLLDKMLAKRFETAKDGADTVDNEVRQPEDV